MSDAFERILSRTFAIDVWAIYEELQGKLKLPVTADRAPYGLLANALDAAADDARKAHLLAANARVALEEFEARVATTEAALRARAQESLAEQEAEGKLGKRKTITNEDVRAEMARIAPDEFERTRRKRAKAKEMVEDLTHLAELFKYRPRTLEVLISTSRST